MAIEYLGHKQNLQAFISTTVCKQTGGNFHTVADIFCGTGAVSKAFKERQYNVISSDILYFCSIVTQAMLLNNTPPAFKKLKIPSSIKGFTRYERVCALLNGLDTVQGFMYRKYSPASQGQDGVERMYFTEDNAGKIDAIRQQIKEWDELLEPNEKAILIYDLIRAASDVSNVAGTYGCYLKKWKRRALLPLKLVPTTIVAGTGNHRVYCCDAVSALKHNEYDIVYADPPYTKRQYAAYYHILETIAMGDEPALVGSTGLRPWQEKSSDFCYKRKAPTALVEVIENVRCNHFFLSYNEDGQIPHDMIVEIMKRYGKVEFFETTYKRYKSSDLEHKGNFLTERLYHLELM